METASTTILLEDRVRHALQPDEPRITSTYLDLVDEVAAEAPMVVRRYLYRRAYQVLLQAICDDSNPSHWRWLCLDHIYRAVEGLGRLARHPAEIREVRTCAFNVQMLGQSLSNNQPS